ncbi:MAG: hypothetical protein KC636_33000, partial [Myxococcales bacterium]|nr:hypothetical protein [Myxococcales bacterium]
SFGDAAAQLGVIVREHPGPLARALAGDDATIWVCAALGERRSDRDEPRCVALCDGYSGDAASRGAAMLRDYVELLAPPLLRLLCAHGVALEAHLQNSLVVFAGGRPRGFVLRDLGGVRLHGPRLARAGHAIELADGSFIATNSAEELRDKLAHVLFHAHLAAVFDWTAQATGADPRAAWAYTRQLVHERLGAWAADPELRADCLADREALLAPRVRAKALLRMRLTGASSDYDYTEVANALAPAPGDDAPRERLLNASGGQGYRP